MNRLGKKSAALMLTATMVAGLAACGKTDQPAAAGNSTPVTQESAKDTESGKENTQPDNQGIDLSEHVKIVYMTTGDPKNADVVDSVLGELNAILTEKANAELEIYYIPWTDYLSNYNLTLAQMDGTVDLIGTASDWLDAWPNSQNGAFLPLSEEMLSTYAPKTWAQVPAENWDMCKWNGDIYLMPEDHFTQWTNHGFMYRNDFAEEAGLSDGAHSWEDMTTYFKSVKANHPDMIPWDSDGTQTIEMPVGWMVSRTDFVPAEGILAGRIIGGSKDDLYKLWSPFYEGDELAEFARLMKEWDEIGVWKTDVLNNQGVNATDELSVGQTAAVQHHTNTWFTEAGPKTKTQQGVDTGFFWFGEERGNVVSLNITHGAMAVSAASKHPERALMVYDLLRNDEECYRLINYGQENVQYEITEDGFKQDPEGYDRDKQEFISNWWWGRNDDLELRNISYDWDSYDKICAEYDKVKIPYPYGQFVPDLTKIQSQLNNITEIHTNYMKQITYGKYKGTPEDIVAEYREALKNAGFEEVLAQLQSQMDALYK